MISKKVRAERLLKLAEFLEALPRKRFDYGKFIGEDWQGAPDLSCGTTACALGWAATMPEFRRLGLCVVESGPYTNLGTVKDLKTGETEESAALRIFGLDYHQADWLFIPGFDDEKQRPNARATAKAVAKHIRRFVANPAVAGEAW